MLAFRYDTDTGVCHVLVNGAEEKALSMHTDAPHGLSCLHIQMLAEQQDYQGTYIKSFCESGKE